LEITGLFLAKIFIPPRDVKEEIFAISFMLLNMKNSKYQEINSKNIEMKI
jgi:hypothetical protein